PHSETRQRAVRSAPAAPQLAATWTTATISAAAAATSTPSPGRAASNAAPSVAQVGVAVEPVAVEREQARGLLLGDALVADRGLGGLPDAVQQVLALVLDVAGDALD